MPLVVPLAAEPAQEVRVTLGGQLCRIRIYSREIDLPVWAPSAIVSDPPTYVSTTLLFLDLYVDDVLLLGGIRCYSGVRLVRDPHLGFLGDLSFYDAYGSDDPDYTGLGTRWLLIYWALGELTEPSIAVPPALLYLLDDDLTTVLLDDNGLPLLNA